MVSYCFVKLFHFIWSFLSTFVPEGRYSRYVQKYVCLSLCVCVCLCVYACMLFVPGGHTGPFGVLRRSHSKWYLLHSFKTSTIVIRKKDDIIPSDSLKSPGFPHCCTLSHSLFLFLDTPPVLRFSSLILPLKWIWWPEKTLFVLLYIR